MDDVVWILTEDERDEIEALYEKRIALENLARSMDPNNDAIYEKLFAEYQKTLTAFRTWWQEKSTQYQWRGENWRIDFLTKSVIALPPEPAQE